VAAILVIFQSTYPVRAV